MRPPLQPLTSLRAARRRHRQRWWSLPWLLTGALLLQAAVPWLASLAAQQRGVALAEVCSVYGVHTAVPSAGAQADAGLPAAAGHWSGGHCVLTPLLTAAIGSAPTAAVALQAPARPRQTPATGGSPPHDPRRAWLAVRAHAPPSLA